VNKAIPPTRKEMVCFRRKQKNISYHSYLVPVELCASIRQSSAKTIESAFCQIVVALIQGMLVLWLGCSNEIDKGLCDILVLIIIWLSVKSKTVSWMFKRTPETRHPLPIELITRGESYRLWGFLGQLVIQLLGCLQLNIAILIIVNLALHNTLNLTRRSFQSPDRPPASIPNVQRTKMTVLAFNIYNLSNCVHSPSPTSGAFPTAYQ
jgi:hypothetical protein